MIANIKSCIFMHIIAFLVIINITIIAFTLLAGQPSYAESNVNIADGGLYYGVPWSLTLDNELIFGEEGKTYTFNIYNDEYNEVPWEDEKEPTYDPNEGIQKISIAGTVVGKGNFSYLFSGCTHAKSIDLSGLDTSQVTNMQGMFYGCSSLSEIDLSGFDLRNVTDMRYMFMECYKLKSLDLSGTDLSNVTNFSGMIDYCNNLSSLKIGQGFNSTDQDELRAVFSVDMYDSENGTQYEEGDIIPENANREYINEGVIEGVYDGVPWMITPTHQLIIGESSKTNFFDYKDSRDYYPWSEYKDKVESIRVIRVYGNGSHESMFSGFSSVTRIDLLNFNCSPITNMKDMFAGCNSLQYLMTNSTFNRNIEDPENNAVFNVSMRDTSTDIIYAAGEAIPAVGHSFVALDESGGEGSDGPDDSEPEPSGKGFRIPEDTNAFRHSLQSFYYADKLNKADLNPIERALYETTYKWKKRAVEYSDYFYVITDAWTSVENTLTYPTSDKFYNCLIRGLNKTDKETIRNQMDRKWEGSCHGIAVTMCLASQDVNTEENGILKTYNKSGKPRENIGFRNAINFYQLSQFVDWGDDTEKTWSPEREPLNYSEDENLGVFLQNLVEEGLKSSRTQKPFVFSFGVHPEEGDDYGHSIVCFGASKYDDDKYTLDLYDENIVDDRNENRYAASFTGYVDLSANTIEFKEPNGKVIDNSNYRYFSYIGIDDLYGRVTSNQTSAGKAKNGKYILLSAKKNFTITNDCGETIVYDDGKSSGTMNVYNARMVAQDGDDTMILDVEPYDSLTVTGMDSEMEISGEIGDEFYTASVEGADSIRINDGGIDITGDEYTFTVGTTAGVGNDELYKLSAKASGNVNLTATEGVLSLDSDDPLSYAVITDIGDNTVSYQDAKTDAEHIGIDTADGGYTIDISPAVEGTGIEKCITSLSNTSYKYNGEACEPEVKVEYGMSALKEGTDFKVSYENNVDPGTAKAMITGMGNYTGSVSLEFTIEKTDQDDQCTNGHTFGTWTTTKEATEQNAGEKTRTCMVCGFTETQVIPKITPSDTPSTPDVTPPTPVNPQPAPIVNPTIPTALASPAEIVDLPTIKISKPKAAKKKITVKWKKVSKKNLKKISGIQIQVATDPGFTNIVKTATAGKKKTSKTIKGLQSKTKYYVRIRAYAAGNYVSAWKSKSIKLK